MRVHPREMTEYTYPDSTIRSQYGTVTFRQWCKREVERINQRGNGQRPVMVVKRYPFRPDGPFNPIALSR